MSVHAMIVVTQWAEAVLAGTPVAGRAWIAHLVARLRRAQAVSAVTVVCQPACRAEVAPHVPIGTPCVEVRDPLAWAASTGAALVARVPVWQLFVDPARLDALAVAPRPDDATVLRAVLDHEPALDLTGGADVEVFTARGLGDAAAGRDVAPGVVGVRSAPAPAELWIGGVAGAGWGVTLQGALTAAGHEGDLSAVHEVMTAAGLHRVGVWSDAAGRGPRRVLTVRCLPARDITWLLAHLGHLPGASIDVLTPAHLADDTARLPGVHDVVPFDGRSFDLSRLSPSTLASIVGRRYDLCVVPRRTPCGRGFENVTPLGAASGAAFAVWMDLTGATGRLAGRPYGWEPWMHTAPPWHEVEAWRVRAGAARRRFTRAPQPVAPRPETLASQARSIADAIEECLDESVTCRALIDAADHGLDLAPVFVHQLPAVAAARAALARATDDGRGVTRPLAAALDRAWLAAIGHLATAPAGAAACAASDDVRQFVEQIAARAAAVVAAGAGSAPEADAVAALDAAVTAPVAGRRR